LQELKSILYNSDSFRQFKSKLKESNLFLQGINGSLVSFIIDHCYESTSKKIIYISDDSDKIFKLKDDLDLINESEFVSAYQSEKSIDNEEQTKSLTNLSDNNEFIVLINAEDLKRNIISKDKFKSSLVELKKDDEYLFEELIQKLEEYNYEKKDFVEEVGDYSVRGGIIDLFPENYNAPLRIEFFGEQIESIREFDINNQRSVREINAIKIGINLAENDFDEEGIKIVETGNTILDYIPEDAIIFLDEPEIISKYFPEPKFEELIKKNKYILLSQIPVIESEEKYSYQIINFNSFPQPDFHSNIKQLYNNLSEHDEKNFKIYLLCSDENLLKRIKSLIDDYEDAVSLSSENNKANKLHIIYLPETLQSGFIIPQTNLLVYTEHQIFGRFFRQYKKRKRKFRGLTFEELKELKRGDYVVHRDFGIGIFSGLRKIKVGNSEQEVVKLSYEEGDTLFLNMNYVNLIKKYSASEGITPKLTRLGGGEWDRIKERTKKKVKDIARDLILLYAKRKSEEGFRFSADDHWQRELEASFIYEDTPDQMNSTEEVKQDMMSENPMDRLVCGDVGFGKTEVAVRAAFKAVLDNKQVAILVPTTILAVQHYNTFRDRLSPFAVEVECITRMNSKKIQKDILTRLEEGKVNILIGTHRLLSKDILFKDLGLLVIDEEQRFGVKAKEKLRAIKPNVDTLTLTATPIPRTLNFSLLGARDLSVINTPPKNRKSIITEIISLDWKRVIEIIRKELSRNGQVYFVNDKISNLYLLADKLKELLPIAKVGIAHGQMDANELEDIIVDFIEKKLNILFCTKIIESGLDIPNVNTIIINNANMYGLSELYQLRGRVGRSEVQAYAYFISPPAAKLTKTAIRRLQAIEEYTELGSGFNLSMRDMEIRGVGNLLGREQSGFISQVGFEMFIDIIDEAVAELKENEFKDIFKDESSLKRLSETVKKKIEVTSTIIENDLNALIPEEYVENSTERLNIYKRLYDMQEIEEVASLADELCDRFGEVDERVRTLLKIIVLKIKATKLGLERINISGKDLSLHFPVNKEHIIYKSEFFDKMIKKLSANKSGKYSIGNNKDKLIFEIYFDNSNDASRLKELEEILNI
jgi:transcription-repair coupling factor (superfamily II helicase)